MTGNPQPPRPPWLARRMIWWLMPRDFRVVAAGDLDEAFAANTRHRGRRYAVRRYWREVFSWSLLAWRREAGSAPAPAATTHSTPLGETMRNMLREFRFATRALRRAPVFTLVALTTLGVGIGANTAIFSVVNGVLLRPLPYPDPEQLVFVWDGLDWIGIEQAYTQPADVLVLRDEVAAFSDVATIQRAALRVISDGEPEQIAVGRATTNLFAMLGTTPLHGRTFTDGDAFPNPQVAVLDHGYWQRRFGGDPAIVGRAVDIGGTPTVVVGILPASFGFVIQASLRSPLPAEVWLPLNFDLAAQERGSHFLSTLARIRPGLSVDQAVAELDAVSRRQDAEFWQDNGFAYRMVPIHDGLVSDTRPVLGLLMGAVGLVLLIACANIATLLLSRARAREHETAMRIALGASSGRIAMHAFAESALLALGGTVLGLALAAAGSGVLMSIMPADLPRRDAVRLDGAIFGFAALVAVGTAVLCGFAPILHGASRDVLTGVKRVGAGALTRRGSRRTGTIIVVAEVALAAALLAGAGLLVRSFLLLQRVDPGFRADGIVTAEITLDQSDYAELATRMQFVERLIPELERLPGVQSAAAATALPLSARASQSNLVPDNSTDEAANPFVDRIVVTPGYFATVGMSLMAGRGFSSEDGRDGNAVAVIDEQLARHWEGGEALGRTFMLLGIQHTVVGVVRHARMYRLHADDRPQVYLPYAQRQQRGLTIAVRTNLDAGVVAPGLRSAVAAVDPRMPVQNVRAIRDMVRANIADRRFALRLMVAFAGTAVALASLGLYGVLAYAVTQQSRDIGVRIALGARPGQVTHLIVRRGLAITLLGAALGLAGMLAISRFLAGLLYGIRPTDPATLGAVFALLAGVSLIACYLPAHRASRVDPAVTLRAE